MVVALGLGMSEERQFPRHAGSSCAWHVMDTSVLLWYCLVTSQWLFGQILQSAACLTVVFRGTTVSGTGPQYAISSLSVRRI
jgi:hypothetical protein